MKIKIPINIRLPMRMLQDIDELTNNRSKFIRVAIEDKLSSDATTISDVSTRQLMAALAARDDVDETLSLLLYAMLNT